MPIVKKKTILNDLHIAFETNLRRKSSKTIPIQLVGDENKDNNSLHDPLETIDEKNQQTEAAAIESVASVKPVSKQNESTEKHQNKVTEFQLHIASYISKIVSLRVAKLAANDEKITQLGMSFFDDCIGAIDITKLVQLIDKARTNLSNERKRLFVVMKRLKRNDMQNYQLDKQMQDVSLEQYYELKAEVNRIGEKLEETHKRMNNSRQQFENDVARATHVREKLFNSQNLILSVMQDVSGVKGDFSIYKQTLCDRLELKKQLRRKNESLKQRVHLFKLMPWYGQTKKQLELTKSFVKKFE
ncbi:uncharacterized protein LOC133392163 isoform X1 [Anopheles gambiae]|uniref:uncharacterized protein LOC133392163 isoform X1 n=1 Tax=Anopheles gambiae TaxID=7165 RepID=UPI002AC8BFE8|nr:uncharacterized protein LOC133392163 isoform X1 [Anopheles gambiae]